MGRAPPRRLVRARGDADDVPLDAFGQHPAGDRAGHEERPLEVGVDDGVPLFLVHLHDGTVRIDRRVVHEYLDPPKRGSGLGDDPVDGTAGADVANDADHAPRSAAECGHGISDAFGGDVDGRHPRALAHERRRDGAADSGARARDEYAPLEKLSIAHVWPPHDGHSA